MMSRQLSKKRHQKQILKQQRGAINILQSESKKMQEKLQQLKKQIQLKKTMKSSMNNTQGRFDKLKSKQMNRFLTTTVDNMNKNPKPNNLNELTVFFSQLKMEQFQEQLKKIGIKSKKQLMELKQTDIEKLPIPPGFRIKLKKALLNLQPKAQQNLKQNLQKIQSTQKSALKISQRKQFTGQNLLDIEAIVDKRNQQKQISILKNPNKFIQLDPFQQQDVFSYNNFVDGQFCKGQYASEDYIHNTQFLKQLPSRKMKGDFVRTQKQYLKEYYETQNIVVPLKSCLKKKPNKKFKQKKNVHFQQQVILNSENSHKKYPKEGVNVNDRTLMKKDVESLQNNEKQKKQVQYCWGCCKLIKQQKIYYKNYLFCSSICENQFKKEIIKTCDNCQKQTNISQLIRYQDIIICQQCIQKIEEVQDNETNLEKIDLSL